MENKLIKGSIIFTSLICCNNYTECCGKTSPEDALSTYLINNGVSKDTASKDNSKILVDFAKNMCLLIDATKENKDNSKIDNLIKAIGESGDKNEILQEIFKFIIGYVAPLDVMADNLRTKGYTVTDPIQST